MIEQLETKRLIKELLYWREEHTLKEKIFKILESQNNIIVEDTIDVNLFDVLLNCEPILPTKQETINTVISDDSKKLYREIVKQTHPDKLKNNLYVEYYNLSTQYYDNNDINNLIIICEQLNIDYNYKLLDKSILLKEIKTLKSKCTLYEKSTFWKEHYKDNK